MDVEQAEVDWFPVSGFLSLIGGGLHPNRPHVLPSGQKFPADSANCGGDTQLLPSSRSQRKPAHPISTGEALHLEMKFRLTALGGFEGKPVDEGTTRRGTDTPCIFRKNPQVPHTAPQVACHSVNNSKGKRRGGYLFFSILQMPVHYFLTSLFLESQLSVLLCH